MAIAVIVGWYGLTIVTWAIRPLDDSVPVGIDYNLEPPRPVSQDVSCADLFHSDPRPRDVPLPALASQPPGKPALAYNREPCTLVHDQARLLLAVDTAAAVVVVGVLAVVVRRGARLQPVPGNAR